LSENIRFINKEIKKKISKTNILLFKSKLIFLKIIDIININEIENIIKLIKRFPSKIVIGKIRNNKNSEFSIKLELFLKSKFFFFIKK
tara:strand:+ start:329 stop:592 length:264 start_codon:yes stop_codon:yes gene_type:complete